MSNGKFCIFCGAPLKDTAKFCASCGNAVAQPAPTYGQDDAMGSQETQPVYAEPTYEPPAYAPEPAYDPRPAYEPTVPERPSVPEREPDFVPVAPIAPPIPAPPAVPVAAAPPAAGPPAQQAPTVPPRYLRPPSYNPTEKLFGELAGRTGTSTAPRADRQPARAAAMPIRRGGGKKWLVIGLVIAGVLALGAAAYFFVLPMVLGGEDPLALGNDYLADGEYDMAIEQFELLAESEPDNARAYTGMAEAYVGLEDIAGALEALELGIENTDGDRTVQRALDRLKSEYGDGANAPPTDVPATAAGAPDDTGQVTIVLQIDSPNMSVNGVPAAIDSLGNAPMLSGGTSMLPLRGILVAMGGDTQFDSEVGSVRAELGDNSAVVIPGSDTAFINGDAAKLSIAPEARNNSMFVPAKLFADAFGASIAWDGNTKTVTLTFEGRTVASDNLLAPI